MTSEGHLHTPLQQPRRLWVCKAVRSSTTSSFSIMASPEMTRRRPCHVRRVRSRSASSRIDYDECSEHQRSTSYRRTSRIRPTRLVRWLALAVVVSAMVTACHAQNSDSSSLGDTVSSPPTTVPRPAPQPRPTTASPNNQPRPTTARPSPSPSPTSAPTPVETSRPTRPTPTPAPETPEPTPEPTSRPAPSPAPAPPEPITPLPVPTPAPPSGVPTPSPVPKLTPGAGVEPTASPPPTASPSPIPTPPPLANNTNVTAEPSVTPSSKPTPTPTPTLTSAPKEASVKASTAPSSSGSKPSDAETSAVKGSSSTSATLTMGLVIGSVAFIVIAAALFVYARIHRRGDDDDDKAEPRREARDLQTTTRNAPGYTQLSPVRQPPSQAQQQQPPQGYGNRLSQLLGPKPLMTRSQDSLDSLHSPPQYGDSVDYNDPAFDVLTPTSDIITVDPPSLASFSSDTSDHVGGFNSLTESGKPKMYRETEDDFAQSVSSAGQQSLTASSAFYTRETGENDVSGDSDSDSDNDDVDIDDADSQDDDIVGLHDSDLTPLEENPWLKATDSMPRLISDTYTNVDDFHDSDPESDGVDDDDDYSDDGSQGSYASARTIDTSFSGFSDTNSGRRMDSELFSDDGNEFDDQDRDPSYLDSNKGTDSFIRQASDLSSGDEFNDSSDDDDDDDDYTDLR